MSWGMVAGAAISAVGSVAGAGAEGKGMDKAQRQLDKLTPIAEGIRAATGDEAIATRERTAGAAAEQAGNVTAVGDRVGANAQPAQDFQDDVIGRLTSALDGDITNTAGYEFNRKESLRGVERAASARGANKSGNVLTELQDRASGLASQEYNSIIGNLQGLLSTTGSITGNAAGQQVQAASSAGNIYSSLFNTGENLSTSLFAKGQEQYGNILSDQITGKAKGEVAKGQSKAGGISGALGAIGSIFS